LGGCGRQPVLAFVEHHRHDRIVVRGTFAGRYVDLDEQGDMIGKRTAEGALTGAVVGILFGPPGLAVGLVAGGTAGGLSESKHADAMVSAFEQHGGRLARHHLSPEAAKALESAVAGSPPATGG
jgi:hypothetical protein